MVLLFSWVQTPVDPAHTSPEHTDTQAVGSSTQTWVPTEATWVSA